MHYCIFSAQYYPHVGGVERYTQYLGKKLIEAGNQVTVVTSNTTNLPEEEEQNGIQIYRLACHDFLNGRYPVFKRNRSFKAVKQKVEAQNFDFVIINTRFYLHSLYGARFAKKRGIPSIVIEHGTSHLSVNNILFDKLGAVYEHAFTFLLKRYCKNYYGVSEACCEWSGHFHIASKGTLYNAVELDEFQKIIGEAKYNYRKMLGISSEEKVVAFTGRLIPEKGVFQLIDAVKRMKDVHLVLAGDGPLREELEKKANENIHFVGQINFEQVVNLLRVSNVFCLPSESEGFPTSVLEAVACKCFVITTFRGGAKELILDESYGIIMKDNSAELIYENLQKVLNNPEYMETATEKSYQRLKEFFTWDATVLKLEAVAKEMKNK